MTETENKILDWMAFSGHGEVGLSSLSIAWVMLGRVGAETTPPADPSDLNRCVKLVQKVPAARAGITKLGETYPVWKRFDEQWDDLVNCFLTERSSTNRCTKTFDMMKEIRSD